MHIHLKAEIFACARCGFCCHGETTVSLDEHDQERMIRALGLSREETARRYWRVTGSTVQMQVRDGLPGSGAVVYADIEAVWLETEIQLRLRPREQFNHAGALCVAQLEEGSDVTTRDEQCVSRRHRKGVADHQRLVRQDQDALRRQHAEGAVHLAHG